MYESNSRLHSSKIQNLRSLVLEIRTGLVILIKKVCYMYVIHACSICKFFLLHYGFSLISRDLQLGQNK